MYTKKGYTMQITSNGYTPVEDLTVQTSNLEETNSLEALKDTEEISLEETLEQSAVEVSLSMNAKIVLLTMDVQDYATNNSNAQNAVLDFLSGKVTEGELSLEDIGYEGKPITELSEEEATELIGEDGFFGVENTANRVADFVFGFSSDDADIISQAREGIVQGFEEAQEIWGGELPQISLDTHARTLEIIDAKIAELNEPVTEDTSTIEE